MRESTGALSPWGAARLCMSALAVDKTPREAWARAGSELGAVWVTEAQSNPSLVTAPRLAWPSPGRATVGRTLSPLP